MSSGISSRRSASICHCGEPVQMASVPHTTWSAPRPRTSMPIIAADTRGSAHVRVREQVRELLLDGGREEALVDADLVVARLEQLLVERVDELVVVHSPRVLAHVLVGVVADRVALERVRLEVADRVIDLLHP